LKPVGERQSLGRTVMLFEGVERERLAAFGEVHRPSIADLFVAIVGGQQGEAQ
jgi:ABC-2 type transport system ATP-binding protein